MFYLHLDENRYLLSVGSTEAAGAPSLESLDGYDFSGYRLMAYRWEDGALVFDADRFAALTAAQDEAERRAERESRAQIQTLAASRMAFVMLAERGDVPEEEAAKLPNVFGAWAPGTDYETGQLREYGDRLYKCRQQHTAQAGWEPDRTPALWALIDVKHAGTIDDPIPYDSGMELFADKYYSQLGAVYRCTRSTGQPVYNALSELVGLYVEAVNG